MPSSKTSSKRLSRSTLMGGWCSHRHLARGAKCGDCSACDAQKSRKRGTTVVVEKTGSADVMPRGTSSYGHTEVQLFSVHGAIKSSACSQTTSGAGGSSN